MGVDDHLGPTGGARGEQVFGRVIGQQRLHGLLHLGCLLPGKQMLKDAQDLLVKYKK